jgi:hypothetical protein
MDLISINAKAIQDVIQVQRSLHDADQSYKESLHKIKSFKVCDVCGQELVDNK